MADVIVMGASGHAKVCIELLRDAGHTVPFCIGGNDATGTCLDVPILAGDDHLTELRLSGFSKAFVAIGDNALRMKLADFAEGEGYELVNAISPRAVVSPSAHLDRGVAIMAGVVVNAATVIGRVAIVNTGATVDHDCRLGAGVHVAPQSGLAGNVTVGDRSFLGIGSRVVPERTIGRDVILGAGSVVISDIPDGVTAVGVPARVIRTESRP